MESHFQAFTPPDASAEKVVVRRGTRSKGCLTCRRRKVKCDEKRPHCDRCKKGYHKCLGYGQPTVFVNYAGEIPEDSSKSNSPVAEQPSQKLAHRSSSGTPPRSSSDVDSNSSFLAASCHNWMITKHSPEGSSMPLIAFKESIVITYLMTKFLMGPPEAFLHGADTSTTYAVLLTRDKSAAYISGLSLAEAFFARMHKLDDMTAHSSKLYTQALRRLHQDLRNDPKRDTINGDMHMDMDIVKNYDTAYLNLWSSLFLGLYEMVLGSTATNWLQHSLGVGALTQSLGPYAFQKPTARAMLETNRVFIIIGASATRTRSFLEQPEWKTIPWALEPESKNISLLIQDAFCDIPGFMEDVDSLRSKREDGRDEDAHALAEDLRAKLTEMFMVVDDLRWRWQDEYPNCCWEKPTTMDSPMSIGPDGELVFNSVLYFSHLDRAIDIIYINIILLLLHHIADQLSQRSIHPFTRPISPLPSLSTIFSNPVILPGGDTPEANAVELCRCLEYVVCGERDSVGFFAMIYPLRIAYFHLGRRKDVQAWIVRILTEGTSNKGFGVARHVLDIHPERQKLR